MVMPRIGKWSTASGKYLIWKRVYYKGKWTPLCKVTKRYN